MELKMQVSEVLTINQILKEMINDTAIKVDPLLKFRFLGIMRALEPAISDFDIIRNEKIMEYGEKSEDGNYQILKDDKEAIVRFNHDLAQVLNSDITVSMDKLKAADIFDKGINAEFLIRLYPIIEE